MSFIKNFQIKINKVTAGYFANWTPESPISVGDYGDIKGYRFTRDGNISRFKLELEIDSVRAKTATFKKKEGLVISTSAGASGEAKKQSARLDLKFGAEGAFLYHLADITNNQFKDRQIAFEKIVPLILSNKIKWKDNYVLVSEIKQAGKAFIIVADSANANMQIECKGDVSIEANLAKAAGDISYTRDSDQVLKYEVEETISPLFRVVAFSGTPSGGPKGPISKLISLIKSWYYGKLPEPETISLSDYVETEGMTEGTFTFPNGESVRLHQRLESIEGYIQKSENEENGDIEIETIEIDKGQRTMTG